METGVEKAGINETEREVSESFVKDTEKGIPEKGCPYVGVFLFFRAVASQVSSAQVSLTSVFGMGTGGPSPPSTPTSVPLSQGASVSITYAFPDCKPFLQIFPVFPEKFFSRCAPPR